MSKKILIIMGLSLTLTGCIFVREPPDPIVRVEERLVCYYDCGWEEVCCYPEYYSDDVEGICDAMSREDVRLYCW
jgi:hypothetical protein